MDGVPTTDDAAGAAESGAAHSGWLSVMVDVSGLSLTELAAEDDSVLARSLRRLTTERDGSGEPIAGFNSAF